MKKLLTLLICSVLFSCTQNTPMLKILSGEAFGTTYTIQYFTEQDFAAQKGIDSVFYVVNRSVSTYMPQSDISKINGGDSTVVVDKIFLDVFEISSEVFEASEGYFDPTIGVLRNAYGFGDVKPLSNINEQVLDSLREFVGFRKVRITSEGNVKKEHSEIYFDFNAVAKGYGIDCLGNFLEQLHPDNYVCRVAILLFQLLQSIFHLFSNYFRRLLSHLPVQLYNRSRP